MNKGRITIHIATRDRHTELAILLESLRHQSYQDFDVLIVDDASGTPPTQAYFISYLITRMKLEGHKFKMIRNGFSQGCCYARNKCIEEDDFDNEFTFRCDDDVVLNSDYIEKLLEVIEKGFDMASGVVPGLNAPEVKRNVENVGAVINKKELDDEGNITKYGDDCGYCYTEDKIILTPEFRTNCLYKSEINKVVSYPQTLTTVSFREEGFFSFGAILEGYTIGINTAAKTYHLQCPSGGNRREDYSQCVKQDDEVFRKWVKKQFQKHGNFLEEYYKNGIYKNKTA